jgi:hypothetical protein
VSILANLFNPFGPHLVYQEIEIIGEAQWLTSVIPAPLEPEIKKIKVQGQHGQKVSKTESQPISWACCYMPVIPTTWEV